LLGDEAVVDGDVDVVVDVPDDVDVVEGELGGGDDMANPQPWAGSLKFT
jgi:hypothetical protein